MSEVVIGGDYITTEAGTGLVHTAPGHGQEDYATGLKYGLPLLSPVDDSGKFTVEAGERFAGLSVLKVCSRDYQSSHLLFWLNILFVPCVDAYGNALPRSFAV